MTSVPLHTPHDTNRHSLLLLHDEAQESIQLTTCHRQTNTQQTTNPTASLVMWQFKPTTLPIVPGRTTAPWPRGNRHKQNTTTQHAHNTTQQNRHSPVMTLLRCVSLQTTLGRPSSVGLVPRLTRKANNQTETTNNTTRQTTQHLPVAQCCTGTFLCISTSSSNSYSIGGLRA